MASVNSTSSNESGCISGGLPLKVMRIEMENKGMFEGLRPGALYCFTGKTTNVSVELEDGTSEIYEVPITFAINGPEELKDGAATGQNYGIRFYSNEKNELIGGELVPIDLS